VYPTIQATGAEMLIVGPGTVVDAQRYRSAHRLPFPVLADEDRAAYRRFGPDRRWGLIQESAVVVIDRHGVVRLLSASVLPGHTVSGGSAEHVVAVTQKLATNST
jgi:peroxiredoxin